MELSGKAKIELRKVLEKEIGLEKTKDFSDAELNEIGVLLLNIFVENLKIRFIDPSINNCK